jgi:hypothetical protein
VTEYELMEHAQMAYGNAIASFTLIFTMLSAYLVVAYFVGNKLTSSQVTIVNSFFILSVVVTIFGELGFLSAGINSSLEAIAMGSSRSAVPLHSSMPFYVAFIDVIITIVCLKFMWDVRHPKTE